MAFRPHLAVLLVLSLGVACDRSPGAMASTQAPGGDAPAAPSDPVARAEQQLEKAQNAESRWRKGGPRSEADVALGLYRGLVGGPLGCRAELHQAALASELTGDPEAIRRTAAANRDTGCSDAAGRIAATVPTFRSEPKPAQAPVPADAPDTAGPVRLVGIEHYAAEDAARIVVPLSGPAEYQTGALPPEEGRGPRLYVDVPGARYAGPAVHPVGGIVERVRVGENDDGARVVLDLRERAYQRVFHLPEPFRLVIDVSKEAPRLHPKTGARAVTRVVLDPGHGGHDPGAVGTSGLLEKDVALDLAHRAAPLIARELGIDTLLTRDVDEFVPLDHRVAKANAFGADLFISLHCNASEKVESRGVMTFVLDESRDAVALGVAARENAASAAASEHLATLLSQVVDAESVSRSAHFADLLQRATMASLQPGFGPIVDGGVRRAGFFVLAGARMPAVLYEVAFISNPVDEQRLDSSNYRQKLADAVVNAVRAYRDGR